MRRVISISTRRHLTSGHASTLDRVVLKNAVFHATHGHLDEEKLLHQRFEVDIVMAASCAPAAATDELADAIDYVRAYEIAQAHLERGPKVSLIETLAERIAADVLANDSRVEAVTVALRKPHVCLPGTVDYTGVEITRRRQDKA